MTDENIKNTNFNEQQLAKKGMILLKSTVIGLFIVLVTLMIAFIMVKNKRVKNIEKTSKCINNKEVISKGKIVNIISQNNMLILSMLEEQTQSQEIIILDAKCGNEINRFKVINK